MQVIGVDIGNSAIKFGIPDSTGTLKRIRVAAVDQHFQPELPGDPCLWSVCSVSQAKADGLKHWIEQNRGSDRFYMIRASDVQISTDVVNREQVGRDRLVAAWMAEKLFGSDSGLVIIDAGTAVTIDYVDVDSVYQGGVIFPGVGSNLKTLARVTHDLPDLETETAQINKIMAGVIGKDTEMAILRGVFLSQLAAFEKISHDISPESPVVATGGVIELMREFLPSAWHYDPLLVLRGAYEIGRAVHGNAHG